MTAYRWITDANVTVPGAMCDKNAQYFVAENEWARSVLVDGGYNDIDDNRFIGPDGSDLHKDQRTIIEHLFGNVKRNNDSVGRFYRKHKDFHAATINAAFILENMRRVFGPKH